MESQVYLQQLKKSYEALDLYTNENQINNIDQSFSACLKILEPKKNVPAWAWAEKNRRYPIDSPYPGMYDVSRTPYAKFVCEKLDNKQYKIIVLIFPTQCGKSETVIIWMGKTFHVNPKKMIYSAPSKDLLIDVMEPKIKDMLLHSSLEYDHKNSKKTLKHVNGTTLRLSSMCSEAQGTADSAPIVVIDELDAVLAKIARSKWVQYISRTGAYPEDGKLIAMTTPRDGVVKKEKVKVGEAELEFWKIAKPSQLGSVSWEKYQEGDRYEYAVKCPHCDEYFIAHSELLRWKNRGLSTCTVKDAKETAFLVCGANGCEIKEENRIKMLSSGDFIKREDKIVNGVIERAKTTSDVCGINFNGTVSWRADYTFGFMAGLLQSAIQSGDPVAIGRVYNEVFAELYSSSEGEVSFKDVKLACDDRYLKGQLFSGFKQLVMVCDPGKYKFHWLVRALWPSGCSMLVDYGTINTYVDIVNDDQMAMAAWESSSAWDELQELTQKQYFGVSFNQVGIDCGHGPERVYKFCKKSQNLGRCIPIRGDDKDATTFVRPSKASIKVNGKLVSAGVVRYSFNSTIAKRWVQSRFYCAKNNHSFWLLPNDVNDDYCRELTGEVYDPILNKFTKIRDNHYLDCEAMVYVISHKVNLARTEIETSVYNELKLMEDVSVSNEVIDQDDHQEEDDDLLDGWEYDDEW